MEPFHFSCCFCNLPLKFSQNNLIKILDPNLINIGSGIRAVGVGKTPEINKRRACDYSRPQSSPLTYRDPQCGPLWKDLDRIVT